MNLCGCTTCSCVTGGYQVHLTIDNVHFSVPHYLKNEGIESLFITNFYSGGDYTEWITSKNYSRLDEALYEMGVLANYLIGIGTKVLRQKIESHPKNNHKAVYKEVHYKVDALGGPLAEHCFFSKNQKGTFFATERFFDREVIIRAERFIVEDVLYDSNLGLDKRLNNG